MYMLLHESILVYYQQVLYIMLQSTMLMHLHTKDHLAQLVITPWKEAISWVMLMSGNIDLVNEWLN